MDKIGPYQILETLYRGPQPLYKARTKEGQEVALKVAPVAGLTPESRERFTREAETCRQLDHPNLVRVFDMGEADGMIYQAMELLVGADLGKVMSENRAFTWDQTLAIMEQVCDGLEYAHSLRLVHRDIKPANIFLEDSGRVRLLDFGMVRVAESNLTKAGSSVGTLNYMAPEQIRGDRCIYATDVFSAGIVFYQLATGRHPFSTKERSLGQVVSAIVFETPPKLTDLAPDAPEGLEFLLNRAMEKDPADRLKNAGELKGAVALCRMTLAMNVPAPPAPLAETKIMKALQVDAAQRGDDGPEKTRVMMRHGPLPAQEPAQEDVVEEGKTKVMRRPTAAQPPLPPPAPPKPVQVPKPQPASTPNLQLRYCPSCTSPNPADAKVCRQCQTPLVGGQAMKPPAAAKSNNLPLYIAIGVAALLAIALAFVLLTK